MCISAAIHIAFIAVISLLLSGNVEPSLVSRVLLLDVRLSQSDDGPDAKDAMGDRRSSVETVRPARSIRIAEVTDQANGPSDLNSMILSESADSQIEIVQDSAERPSGGDVTGDYEPADLRLDDSLENDHPQRTESNILTAVSAIGQPAPPGQSVSKEPVAVMTPMSHKQKEMLSRKFRELSEKFYRLKNTESGMAWKHEGLEYIATFRQLPAQDNMSIGHVVVEVSTEENGNRLSTRMRMNRLTFSNFAQFVHRWDPDILMHNDELDGRFHSNSRINLGYNRHVRPIFHGKVTTASGGIDVVNARGFVKRDEIFLGGLETGVKRIPLPKHASPFPDGATARGVHVERLDEDARITFYRDGSYGWKYIESDSPEQTVSISDDPTYIIGAPKKKLHVKGIVRGKVLVYSPERILIDDDLTYAYHPEVIPGSDDYLGLVSEKYIDIETPDITGPGDLQIHASIYAKRRFTVKGYRTRENAMLFIFGSLTAGSLSATEPRYYTKIQFDKRLEKFRAPGFPVTDRYEVEVWDGVWTTEPLGM